MAEPESAEGLLRTLGDRVALRELVDSYAHAVDRRRPDLFSTLFCADGQLVLPHPAGERRAAIVLDGADGWAQAFAVLASCAVTTHFVGNQLVWITDDDATGETYCLAHELHDRDGVRRMLVRGVRYADVYRRVDGRWRFRSRSLTFDWLDERPLEALSPFTSGSLG